LWPEPQTDICRGLLRPGMPASQRRDSPRAGAPLLRDYWLDEGHGPCAGGCGFELHGALGLYMADPSPGVPPTELDGVISQMFEARFTSSFALEDLCDLYAAPDVDLNHYRVKAAIQRAPIEATRFMEMVSLFRKNLAPEQRPAMASLDSVAKKILELRRAMEDLRGYSAHSGSMGRPGSGVHGVANMAKRTDGPDPELEDKVIKSAHLISMYADCLRHKFPGCFRSALSKAAVGDLGARLPDPDSWLGGIADFKVANPIAAIVFDRVGAMHAPLMSELLRIRNALLVVPAVEVHLRRIVLESARAPRLWTHIQHRRLAYYEQYAALETINFFDLYGKIKTAGLVEEDDNVIRLLNQNEAGIRALRQLVAHWKAGSDFVTAVNEGIGHKRLLHVAALVGEWARLNGNGYIEKCGLGDVPELDQMNRRLALGRIEHEVGLMREEARSRGAGEPGPDCPP